MLSHSPAIYYPFSSGDYTTKPMLKRFPADLGQGPIDNQLFQLDNQFADYRRVKLQCRHNLQEYYCRLPQSDYPALYRFIVQRLCEEHPPFFSLQTQKSGYALQCRLSDEILQFDHDYRLQPRQPFATPVYIDSLDALANQLQEDIVILDCSRQNNIQSSALHLCFPNHWSAREKLAQNFAQLHEKVPQMEELKLTGNELLHKIQQNGPYLRFAWGVNNCAQLDLHPRFSRAHIQADDSEWCADKLYIRVERQILSPIADTQLLMFSIRTYIYRLDSIIDDAAASSSLAQAIASMSPDTLIYKGLREHADKLIQLLRAPHNKNAY